MSNSQWGPGSVLGSSSVLMLLTSLIAQMCWALFHTSDTLGGVILYQSLSDQVNTEES